jgi:hypothetical protein
MYVQSGPNVTTHRFKNKDIKIIFIIILWLTEINGRGDLLRRPRDTFYPL